MNANSAQKTLINSHVQAALLALIADTDNIAYTPFRDGIAAGGGVIDQLAVEYHGGRAAAIQVIGSCDIEILLQERI